MFSLASGIYESYLAPVQVNILVVGAPGAGKTALLERIKVTDIPKRPPAPDAQHVPTPLPRALEKELEAGGMPPARLKKSKTTRKEKQNNKTSNRKKNKSENEDTEESNAAVDGHATPSKDRKLAETAATAKSPPMPSFTPTQSKRRRFPLLFCPAPERYRKTDADQDEDIIMDDDDDNDGHDDGIVDTGDTTTAATSNEGDEEIIPLTRGRDITGDDNEDMQQQHNATASPPQRVRLHSREMSMSSIDLADDDDNDDDNISIDSIAEVAAAMLLPTFGSDDDAKMPTFPDSLYTATNEQQQQQYDLKRNAKMLPFNKIRPTIGTNLAKLDICGMKCHFFDVGGKLQNLWERYYDDCDAVIFVWKMGSSQNDSKDDDDDEPYDYTKQYELLHQVRSSIPTDTIPFLILGHSTSTTNTMATEYTQHFYSIDRLLPRSNNNVRFTCVSTTNGNGIQNAMKWFIPMTKVLRKEQQRKNE
mmetsp:Transcript_9671/g.27524  ORF Transcript_9671/g.27524 Transcript_9671/m.27524 type:complete len:476 (+) Transcript_9671:337-1764(+)|eukprot:CAMPEP_0119550972 /NCGR_PEP_ID=MMETSP1352-20130426/4381_1 /TAXON_ID=265584 /ORGANISM="Stauroneis constricta, Strain CCMP1120" /LENGTH=475 /DNA_ID=CAMNT_0007596969 /DNA_START=321 /DNA_END=1748 /DNA_ORIENTATION=-